jgi:1,4-alpha-glucan branching enzyme
VVFDISKFKWTDSKWLKERDKTDTTKTPASIYELHLGSFKKPEDGREFYNYRELAPMVIDYVKQMHFTHIELMPITEHPLDASWGYQVTGYYAPTSRYGTPLDFKYFINELHNAGIGVILDWVPAHFPRDTFGLCGFDGTCLYEHYDPRQNSHPDWGTLVYNYARPEVKNFLIGSALFWAEEYHVDGIRSDAVASMLYLDYGRKDGEWVPNIYGGKENLDAVEFLKHMNSIFKKLNLSTLLIAEESTAWPKVTGVVEDGSLGFDYKWNMGWMNDFLDFMRKDPLFRKGSYGELTFSMIYNYSENFILVFSHDEVVHGKASMLYKMPGDTIKEKFANLRAAYGFMFTHPGKKLLFMGQDFGQTKEWSESEEIMWELLEDEDHKQMQRYVRDLNTLYQSEPALYTLDYSTDGFKWINCISANETIVVFRRISDKNEELIVVANFTPVSRANYKIGVPYPGKYKEIFNSDRAVYGGSDFVNPRLKMAKKDECDGLENSIRIKVPPLGITVFRYIPLAEEELIDNEAALKNIKAEETSKAKKAPVKRTAKKTK